MTYLSDAKLKNKFYGFDIITSLSFLAALVFLLWKASYGIVSLDESFYSTVLYRLWQGDGMIVHEWHPGQLFSFLLLPIFSLFMAISGSTDGVFLFLRLLFVAAQFTGAVYIYIRLRHNVDRTASKYLGPGFRPAFCWGRTMLPLSCVSIHSIQCRCLCPVYPAKIGYARIRCWLLAALHSGMRSAGISIPRLSFFKVRS